MTTNNPTLIPPKNDWLQKENTIFWVAFDVSLHQLWFYIFEKHVRIQILSVFFFNKYKIRADEGITPKATQNIVFSFYNESHFSAIPMRIWLFVVIIYIISLKTVLTTIQKYKRAISNTTTTVDHSVKSSCLTGRNRVDDCAEVIEGEWP